MAYGVGRGALHYEPADAALATESEWNTRKYLNFIPKLFDELRSTYGFDHHLLHDVHHRLTPIEAGRLEISSRPMTCSGWGTPPRPRTRRRSSSSASTRRRRSPWVRSSIRSGTPRT
jgi:hypothetical protein